MCTVIAISLIFHRKGQERREKWEFKLFLLQRKVLCKIRQQLDKKTYAIVLQVVLYERQYHCANNLT